MNGFAGSKEHDRNIDSDKASGHRSARRISFKRIALTACVAVPAILVGCVLLMGYFGSPIQPEFECLKNDQVGILMTTDAEGANIHVGAQPVGGFRRTPASSDKRLIGAIGEFDVERWHFLNRLAGFPQR